MISSDGSTRPAIREPTEVSQTVSSSTHKQTVSSLHYMMWVCLLAACLGASWFSYQYFLVPQPKSFAPDWHGAQWIQAADGNAPVAYFRYVTDLNVVPDAAFVTVAANQVFRLYVNGSYIGSNQTDFSQGNFPRAYIYDVASSLLLGSNVIALRVVNSDEQTPSVEATFGVDVGRSVYYHVTGDGWQATSRTTIVYPQYAVGLNASTAWTHKTFNASSWLPVQKVEYPTISPMLIVNPLLYEQPISTHWMSVGTGHDAYFVRQISLPVSITGTWLRVAAIGTINIFINGNLFIVGNYQPATPPQNVIKYRRGNRTTAQYQSNLMLGVYDISPYLHPGLNTIAVHISAPGVNKAQDGLANVNAALTLDMLMSDYQNHDMWLTSDAGWHVSHQAVADWIQGSSAALTWPFPVFIGRPGRVTTVYLANAHMPNSIQLIPLSLVCEVILFGTGAILGLWLLMSLVFTRGYYRSRRDALETMSLAYLPAVACEAMLMALSREPQIPQPFPYTWLWGLVLVMLVGIGYIILWLNAWTARKQRLSNNSNSAKQSPLSATIGSFPHGALLGEHRVLSYLRDYVLAWLRIHWAIILLVLIAVPLIFYNLSYEPYWQDELTSYYAAKSILAHGLPFLPSGFLYAKGELYSYVLALSMVIFGDQAGAPRIVSAVEYLISLPLLYFVGCYFFERRLALLATAMLALSPIAFVWGREVRMYEQAQVLTLLVVYVFYKAIQERQRVRLVYLAIGCLIAMYLSHEETFIILPALVICVMMASRDGKHRLPAVLYQKHWWYAAAIGVSAIAIQLLIVKVTHPPVLGTDQTQRPLVQLTTDDIQFYIGLLFFQTSKQPWIIINSVLATVGCIWARRSRDLRVKYCALFLAISFFTLLFVFTARADRYFYPLLPIYYLMGAYAVLVILNAIWAFARSRMVLPQPGRTFGDHACHPEPFASLKGKLREGAGSTGGEILRCAQDDSAAPGGYFSRSMKAIVIFTMSLVCACVLIGPILPIGNYNLFISRFLGFSYHRHYGDYDVAGQYVQQHWQKGDIVISISPNTVVYYYVGHSDYFFSIDRALFLFERDGHIVDTYISKIALLDQEDFQAVLAQHARIWLITARNYYQTEALSRFIFPTDFHIVYEGFESVVYLRGG